MNVACNDKVFVRMACTDARFVAEHILVAMEASTVFVEHYAGRRVFRSLTRVPVLLYVPAVRGRLDVDGATYPAGLSWWSVFTTVAAGHSRRSSSSWASAGLTGAAVRY